MTEATYAELLRLAESQLQNGSSVIIDASFMHKNLRAPFACWQSAFPYHSLSCMLSAVKQNLSAACRTRGEATSVSDGRVELLALQAAGFEAPDETEGTLITLSAKAPPESMADTVYTGLAA